MAKPKLALIPATQGSKLYSVLPADGVGDFTFSRGSAATRINKDGLIETVASGVSRLNYPLIDGVVNGCPSHLLEPSRTNKLSTSNDFNGSGWVVSDITATANQVVSPDGTLNASKLEMTGNGSLRNLSEVSFNDGYAYSIFIKKGNSRYVTIRSAFFTQSIVVGFDLDTLTAQTNGKIEDYGNDWYRLSITKDISGDADRSGFFYLYLPDSLGSQTSVSGNYAYFYGGQIEDGNYPTSYIPTNGSAVTRSAETANGAGDSTTFGSEGVLFAEISALVDDGTLRSIAITDGTVNNIIVIRYNSYLGNSSIDGIYVNNNVLTQAAILYPNTTDFTKIALSYQQGALKLYVNGVLEINVALVVNDAINWNTLQFDIGNGTQDFYGNVRQVQSFNEVLTDADLETLTSWTSFTDMANGQLYSIK